MRSPAGYMRKRRQKKLARWTDGAALYLRETLAHPTRHKPHPQPHTEVPVHTLRQSSGFGKSVRHSLHQSFTGQVMVFMRKHNRSAASVCRTAAIPRSLLAKLLSDQCFRPTRELALLLTVGLHLRLHEADKLLATAGYALSHHSPQDIVLEYFLRLRLYRLGYINEVLRRLGIPPIENGGQLYG